MVACAPRSQWLYGLFFEPVRSLRLSVRTPGFQPGKRGSIPLGTATDFFPLKNQRMTVLGESAFRSRKSQLTGPVAFIAWAFISGVKMLDLDDTFGKQWGLGKASGGPSMCA